MPEIDLDEPATYARLDPDGMFRRVNELPAQIERAWQLGVDLELPPNYRSVQTAVIAGMGGSAIGGSLLASYGIGELPIPLTVWRNYGLPSFVGRDTLVVVASYSGDTEETISALRMAHERGARLLVVTTGGAASSLAEEWRIPALRFNYVAQPRATLGYLFTPLLAIFSKLGFLPPQHVYVREAIEEAREARRQWGGESPISRNQAKALARLCHGRQVVVYGAGYLGEVAHRWKTQLNENAKTWAFWEELPELNHNAIVGYEFPPAISDSTQVVLLRGSHLAEPIQRRLDVTTQVLDQYHVRHAVVDGQGEGMLAQMISLIALGDYVSYYLALLSGADPTTIAPIDFLKQELAKTQAD
jgi:glucose/mannose-6-phosphate isomerase